MLSPKIWLALAALVAGAGLTKPAHAATSGQNGTHDPSRIIESDGKFYFCGTGGGCASSSNGLAWSSTGLRIPIPSWSTMYTNTGSYSGNQGIWAPDIVFYDAEYYIFYSFCAQPAAHAPCTIGIYTTPTLDSTSSKFKLTDAGKVVNNPPNTTGYQFSTIDPAPVIDAAGNLWTSWGSGYGKDTSQQQIFVTRLDTSGLPLASDLGYKPPMTLGYGLHTGGIEGSYIHYHSGYYYLFWNSGGCCSGASSTYTIHVARSQVISGPYTGDRVWYGPTIGSIHGPGHVGIYSACGVERFTYHYYPNSGGSVLGENDLSWGTDGWPVVGPESTTPLTPCGNPTTGAGGTGGTGGASGGSSGGSGAGGNGGSVSAGEGVSPGNAGTTTGGAQDSGGSVGLAGTSSVGDGPSAAGSTSEPSGGSPSGGSAGLSPEMTAASPASGCTCSFPGGSQRGDGTRLLLVAGCIALTCMRRKLS